MSETTDHDLLVRIDERTTNLHTGMAKLEAGMNSYITRKEFVPVRSIVYGSVAIMGTAVVGSIASLIIK